MNKLSGLKRFIIDVYNYIEPDDDYIKISKLLEAHIVHEYKIVDSLVPSSNSRYSTPTNFIKSHFSHDRSHYHTSANYS